MFDWIRRLFSDATAPSVRRYRKPPARLTLESLEDRITPSTTWTVNLTTDTGGAGGQQNGQDAGNLRYCVTHAATGDTINFDSTVFNQATTITLTQGEIHTNQSLTINNQTGNQISISGNNQSRIFDFDNQNLPTGQGLSETISNRTRPFQPVPCICSWGTDPLRESRMTPDGGTFSLENRGNWRS